MMAPPSAALGGVGGRSEFMDINQQVLNLPSTFEGPAPTLARRRRGGSGEGSGEDGWTVGEDGHGEERGGSVGEAVSESELDGDSDEDSGCPRLSFFASNGESSQGGAEQQT